LLFYRKNLRGITLKSVDSVKFKDILSIFCLILWERKGWLMNKMKILLVEDDELASEIIYMYLIENGFDVTPTFTATDSVSRLRNEHFDLLILDINLPDFNGFEVLKSIKNITSLPIIITSAYEDRESKLLAFKYGASDYMSKPIDLEELEARMWVQLGKTSEIRIESKKRVFELRDGAIFFKGELLSGVFTVIELDIFTLLVKNSNQVIAREDLVAALSSISSPRSLDNHIKNIRKKIGDSGSQSHYLKTEYGVGYILNNPNY